MSTYIHIGYPKTATSWFKNYFYPFVANANTIYNDNIVYNANTQQKIELKTAILDKEHQIIVSHKFSGLVDFQWEKGKYRKYFAPQLKKSFPDAKIVIFLRNQVDFMASAYSSYLTHGGTYTFRKLHKLGLLTDGQMFAYEYLDYLKLISQYKEYFGKKNVLVFLYEDFQRDKKKFVQDYCKRLNLDLDIENLNFKIYNKKLRKGFAGFVRFSNKFSRKGVKPKKCLINAPFVFSWINSRTSLQLNKYKIWGGFLNNEKILGEKLIDEINNYYRDSNKKLIKYEGCETIREYDYPL